MWNKWHDMLYQSKRITTEIIAWGDLILKTPRLSVIRQWSSNFALNPVIPSVFAIWNDVFIYPKYITHAWTY